MQYLRPAHNQHTPTNMPTARTAHTIFLLFLLVHLHTAQTPDTPAAAPVSTPSEAPEDSLMTPELQEKPVPPTNDAQSPQQQPNGKFKFGARGGGRPFYAPVKPADAVKRPLEECERQYARKFPQFYYVCASDGLVYKRVHIAQCVDSSNVIVSKCYLPHTQTMKNCEAECKNRAVARQAAGN